MLFLRNFHDRIRGKKMLEKYALGVVAGRNWQEEADALHKQAHDRFYDGGQFIQSPRSWSTSSWRSVALSVASNNAVRRHPKSI